MHFVFIPYGKRDLVELLLRDMEAQKFEFPIWKGEEKSSVWMQGVIRTLPFGVCEYVFPKESMEMVLNTLIPLGKRYDITWIREKILQTLFKTDKIPDYTIAPDAKKFLWMKDNVNIIPIGIRHDPDTQTRNGSKWDGWEHEAI